MIDAGEQINVTLKREFGEEALNSIEVAESRRDEIKTHVDKIFQNGIPVSHGHDCACALDIIVGQNEFHG